ncbi:MAG: HTH domain-containing protein [Bacillota bacterium]|nr:HTH domain-containing protein [Bacillota bacterium]
MNRCANTIKMLLLLSERGKMSAKDLSNELHTNPRNIREYKKELVEAGFPIKHTVGYYGGYELDGCKVSIDYQ